jgi:prepilin-type N-terminal cleavage/methylation domain-containing protein
VISKRSGFTLIEIMVAMAISILALAAIYGAFQSQQRSQTTQQMVVDMQQNARAALALMCREIRMAGYQPLAHDGVDNDGVNGIDDPGESNVQGFVTARSDIIKFTLDLNADGDDNDDNESITYGFYNGTDANGDGIADAGAAPLGREHRTGAGFQALAFDIEAVAFAYAFDADSDGALDTYGGAADRGIIWAYDSNGGGALDRHIDTNVDGVIDESDTSGGESLVGSGWASTTVPLNRIRAVQIWLLARTRNPVQGHQNTQIYVVGPKRVVCNDQYKRILLNGVAYVRNPS